LAPGVACRCNLAFARALALRDASSSALKEGWGRGMAPRGLGWLLVQPAGSKRETRHPASPRSLCASWITEVFHLLDPWPAAEGPGCSCPVPCEQRPRLNGTHFSCRWLRSSIPTDLTARSHRPRAVEHRDCPPCGGDGRIITQVRGGGDGGFSIPQLNGFSGLMWKGLALLDSAEVRSTSRCHPCRAT